MARRPLCLVCLILMLGMCLADLAGIPLIRGIPLPETVQTYIEKHPDAVIIGEVQKCQATDFSFSVYLKQVSLICRSEKISIENVRVFLKNEEKLPAGTLVSVSGKLECVGAPRNPGEFDSVQYYACQHIYYFMKNGVIKRKSCTYSRYQQKLLEVKNCIQAIIEQAAGKEAPVFEAMLLGEKGDLDLQLKLRYQIAGVVHILAISGLHISILGMGFFSLLKRVGMGNGMAGILALLVMLQYGIMTGGSVSAMRAVCMFVLLVGSRILGRTYDLLTALSASAILLLLDSPAYLYSSSFLLSFGAVVGIGVVSPYLIRITGARRKIGKALLSSLSVQLVTLPVMLVFFGEISVAGIFLNLIVLPTVGGVLISGLCCGISGFVCLEMALICAMPGRVLLRIYEKLCILAGKLPFCTWIGGKPEIWQSLVYYVLLAVGIGVGVLMSGKLRKDDRNKNSRESNVGIKNSIKGMIRNMIPVTVCGLIIFAGGIVLSQHSRNELQITCLDIGQGDGIVLEMPQGGVFLMDCGSSNKKNIAQYQLLPYLKSRGISYVDGIFVSHTDNDHISGLLEFLEYMAQDLTSVKAGVLMLPVWKTPPEAYKKLEKYALSAGLRVLHIEKGDDFLYGDINFRILAPSEEATGEDANEDGMVMELDYGKFRGIFTGDIGADTEKKLLHQFQDVDFLKTAHHGSRYSTCQEFLDQVKPEFAVISCSDSNTYGHPSPETTFRMVKSGVKVEYTMKNGAITIHTDGEKIWTERFLEENKK